MHEPGAHTPLLPPDQAPAPQAPPPPAPVQRGYGAGKRATLALLVVALLAGIWLGRTAATWNPATLPAPAALLSASATATVAAEPTVATEPTVAAMRAAAQPTPAGLPTTRPAVAPATQPTALTATAAPADAPPATQPPAATPIVATAADEAAIKQVIQQGNDDQVKAIAERAPSAVGATATSEYHRELVQTNQGLLDNGVESIALLKLEWGPFAVAGSTATATTYETWSTTYKDGTTEQSRDQNDYHLVLEQGAWKISADDHPQGTPAASGPAPTAQPVPPAPAGLDPQGESRNWSGYAADGGTFTAVSGTWIVPQPAADGTAGADAAWIGIGGLNGEDLIQAGTDEEVLADGRVVDHAWIEMLPDYSHPIELAVHPGDSVSVSITQAGKDSWKVAFVNTTTGKTYGQTVQYTSSLSSAEWIEEAPSGRGGLAPLANFGTLQFTAASAVKDGQTVTPAAAKAQPITMINRAGRPLAVPSELGADGASFSVSRTAASASEGRTPGGRRRRSGG